MAASNRDLSNIPDEKLRTLIKKSFERTKTAEDAVVVQKKQIQNSNSVTTDQVNGDATPSVKSEISTPVSSKKRQYTKKDYEKEKSEIIKNALEKQTNVEKKIKDKTQSLIEKNSSEANECNTSLERIKQALRAAEEAKLAKEKIVKEQNDTQIRDAQQKQLENLAKQEQIVQKRGLAADSLRGVIGDMRDRLTKQIQDLQQQASTINSELEQAKSVRESALQIAMDAETKIKSIKCESVDDDGAITSQDESDNENEDDNDVIMDTNDTDTVISDDPNDPRVQEIQNLKSKIDGLEKQQSEYTGTMESLKSVLNAEKTVCSDLERDLKEVNDVLRFMEEDVANEKDAPDDKSCDNQEQKEAPEQQLDNSQCIELDEAIKKQRLDLDDTNQQIQALEQELEEINSAKSQTAAECSL